MSRNNKGFTLIEMAVVLGIIAILAAILTPIAVGYIDQARTTRAEADVRAIAKAYLLYYRDSSAFPIYQYRTGGTTFSCQMSGVTTSGGVPTGSHSGWAGGLGCAAGTSFLMRSILNLNSWGLATNPGGGAIAWRGPYLDGLDMNDPWGTPYFVNSKSLDALAANNRWGFAISAGPNGTLDTDPQQAKTGAFAVSGDDIVALIK
jgi:prepilin-type N-terminal cleavage/methylation domain-containing protein